MFPEFLAGDMTFGLNRQKRNLYVITGIDGHNKIFTAFRCWMPSKQKAAYTWVLKIAFPQLVGIHTTSRIHCLASDDEPAMVDAINDAINSPDSSMSKVKHRLDYYHLFVQKWYSMGIPDKTNKDRTGVADNIFQKLHNQLSVPPSIS